MDCAHAIRNVAPGHLSDATSVMNACLNSALKEIHNFESP